MTTVSLNKFGSMYYVFISEHPVYGTLNFWEHINSLKPKILNGANGIELRLGDVSVTVADSEKIKMAGEWVTDTEDLQNKMELFFP